MKTLVVAAAISAALFTQHAQAQTPLQPPSPLNKGPRPEEGLRPVSTVQGKVASFTSNDDYVYDGFVLLNGGDSVWVKFPPHMGRQVLNAIKIGSNVSANGDMRTNPEGRKDLRFMSLSANGQTLTDTQPAAAPMPVSETGISGSGKITALQTDRQGRTRGLVVDGSTILHMPPHVADQLNSLVQVGSTISYSGYKKEPKDGEVSTGNYTIIHVQTLTVNGQQYLTR